MTQTSLNLEIKCNCEKVIPRRVSKSENNPGRAYYKCETCNYWEWEDKITETNKNLRDIGLISKGLNGREISTFIASQKAPEIIADGSYSKNLDVSTSSTSSLGPSMVVSHVSSPSTNTNNKDRLIKAKILEINYLRSESDKTKQKMKNLSESNILLEKENTELLERIKSLEKENAELKEKNNVRDLDLHLGSSSEDQELYEKIHLLEQEKSEFKDQIKTIEQENSELQNQIKTMKKEMSESKESFQLDKVMVYVEQLTARTKELDNEKQALLEENRKLKKENRSLKNPNLSKNGFDQS